LLEDIIARQMQTKTYMLPIDLVASTEEREPDICVICQVFVFLCTRLGLFIQV